MIGCFLLRSFENPSDLCENRGVIKLAYVVGKWPFKCTFNFMRRKLENKEVRKIFKKGASYCVTLPVEIVRELKWKGKQKVVVKRVRGGLMIKDWKK